MTKQELMNEALVMLQNEDGLFCEAVEELDSWNGFADGFRCYGMWELDDIYGDMKLSEFLDLVNDDFNNRDDYLYHDVYGLHSTNDRADVYRDNTDAESVLDELIDKWNHMEICGSDRAGEFNDIMDDLYNENFDDEEAQDFTWKDEE